VLTTIYIGVGSNLDPERSVPLALAALAPQLEIEASSNFYWSAPLERPEQERFLNGVWRARTDRSPRQVKFEILRPTEATLGRRRQADKHAARSIDLDLLMHGQCQLQEPDLILPDPEIPLRDFLWQPLSELLPPGQSVPGFSPDHPPAKCPQRLELAPEITEQLRLALHPARKGKSL
jgi:2-amino-4-hydroxy-6-hydroxymethyldihydropteridine diphosphokinase